MVSHDDDPAKETMALGMTESDKDAVLDILWSGFSAVNVDPANGTGELGTMESAKDAYVAALWPQLSLVNLSIERLKRKYDALDWKVFDGGPGAAQAAADCAEINQAKIWMESIRDSIRTCINACVRYRLRPLSILDLPDELLMDIFDYVKGRDDHELYLFNWKSNVDQIKSLRLACRRFRATSSHLLLRWLHVSMTRDSIAHLNEVASHPTISKGIRAIQVSLQFYDSVLACDTNAFAAYQASRLRNSIRSWESMIGFSYSGVDDAMNVAAIAKALSIAASWEDAAINGICADCADHVLLRRAQARYKQCYEDQKHLRRTFTRSIASAMARMPTATWLDIHDQNPHQTTAQTREASILAQDMDQPSSLLGKLLAPIRYWEEAREHGLGEPPAEVIPNLLVAIHDERVRLTGLKLWAPPSEDPSLLLPSDDEFPKLKGAVKYLKVLDFHPRRVVTDDGFWGSRYPDEVKPLSSFLSTLLDSKAIQRISLDFGFLCEQQQVPSVSMGHVVLSHVWSKLEDLEFTGPFHFKELQNVVNRAEKKLSLRWSGYLVSGSWAEVLDFLKGRVSFHSSIGTVNSNPSGAEYEEMEEKERKFIFHERYRPPYRESQATLYIRGIRWPNKRNPVVEWERGELDLSEELDLLEELDVPQRTRYDGNDGTRF
ncbi:Uu.00g020130.m01.CDS01 [Anthostomella pinea]|uniref:Uu.00g020130.m01.CDS01 n=1 Tax=Anthostomella pinea TaxID=933095 RepID=A0AAI8YQP4_9PEZI|nr:Uu.00g020130.m01.CDS01 [Anthostomella pinea]